MPSVTKPPPQQGKGPSVPEVLAAAYAGKLVAPSPVEHTRRAGQEALAATAEGAEVAAKVALMIAVLRRNRGGDDPTAWIVPLLRPEFPVDTVSDAALRAAAAAERDREEVFLQRMKERLVRDLTEALRSENRQAAIDAILEREKSYTQLHDDAAAARVEAALRNAQVKQLSPQGAYWVMSPHVKEHTPDCVAMAAVGWWPWEVLDRWNPPLHTGCACELLTHEEAQREGLMGSQIPDTIGAVAKAETIHANLGLLESLFWLRDGAFSAPPREFYDSAEDVMESVHISVPEPHRQAILGVDNSLRSSSFSTPGGSAADAEKAEIVEQDLQENAMVHTGVMVALYPRPEDAAALAQKGTEPSDELHVTLAFLGSKYGPGNREGLEAAVAKWARTVGPLKGQISGTGHFTSGPKPVTYASVDLPALPTARERLVALLDRAGYPPKRDHGFTPHMTLAYKRLDVRLRPRDVVFDRVTVSYGDVQTSFPLSADLQEGRLDPLDIEEIAWDRRYAKGTIWGGRFMPKRGGVSPRITLKDLFKDISGPSGQSLALRGDERPAIRVPDVPHPSVVADAERMASPALSHVTHPGGPHHVRSFDELATEMQDLAARTAKEQGVPHTAGTVTIGDHLADTGGQRDAAGNIQMGPEGATNLQLAAEALQGGKTLPDDVAAGSYHAYRTLAHEMGHNVNPIAMRTYQDSPSARALEEALTEEMAHVQAVELLKRHGQHEVLRWLQRHPDDMRAQGVYGGQRAGLLAVLDAGHVPLEHREDLLRTLAFNTRPENREAILGGLVAKAQGVTPEEGLNQVRQTMSAVDAIDPLGQGASVLRPANNVDARMRLRPGATVTVSGRGEGNDYEGKVLDAGYGADGRWYTELEVPIKDKDGHTFDTTWRYPDPADVTLKKEAPRPFLKGDHITGRVREGDSVRVRQNNGDVLVGELRGVEAPDAMGWKGEVLTDDGKVVVLRPTSVLDVTRARPGQESRQRAPEPDVTPATPAEIHHENAVKAVAHLAHEDWRAERKLPAGSHEPRIKPTTDAAWIEKHGTDHVDIANNSYAALPADHQENLRRGAETAVSAIQRARRDGETLDIEQLSSEVHDSWRKAHRRDKAAKAAGLLKPYADLSDADKGHDRQFVTHALDVLRLEHPEDPNSPEKQMEKLKQDPSGDLLFGPANTAGNLPWKPAAGLADVDGPQGFDARRYQNPKRALITKVRALAPGDTLTAADGTKFTRGHVGHDSVLVQRTDGSRRRYATTNRMANAEMGAIARRHGIQAPGDRPDDKLAAEKAKQKAATGPTQEPLTKTELLAKLGDGPLGPLMASPPIEPAQAEDWIKGGAYGAVLHHGTSAKSAEAIRAGGFEDPGRRGYMKGIWFTDSPDTAGGYGGLTGDSTTLDAAVRLDNPLTVDLQGGKTTLDAMQQLRKDHNLDLAAPSFVEDARKAGFDGVLYKHDGSTDVQVIDPEKARLVDEGTMASPAQGYSLHPEGNGFALRDASGKTLDTYPSAEAAQPVLDALNAAAAETPPALPVKGIFRPGHHVEGTYHGVPYSGSLSAAGRNEINKNHQDLTVKLDQPIDVNGSTRTGLQLDHVNYDGNQTDSQGNPMVTVRLQSGGPTMASPATPDREQLLKEIDDYASRINEGLRHAEELHRKRHHAKARAQTQGAAILGENMTKRIRQLPDGDLRRLDQHPVVQVRAGAAAELKRREEEVMPSPAQTLQDPTASIDPPPFYTPEEWAALSPEERTAAMSASDWQGANAALQNASTQLGMASPPIHTGTLFDKIKGGSKKRPKKEVERSKMEAPPAPVSGIPDYSGVELKDVKAAGGSNGARFAEDGDGNRWLVKSYRGHQDRVATEVLSNSIYRELGVAVPNAGLHTPPPAADYAKIPDEPIPEPPLPDVPKGKQLSSGMIVVEPDGRLWVFEPKGGFGGYDHTFSKGRVEPDLTPQQNARKELAEETGLRANPVGYLGDFEGDKTVTRFYVARRTAEPGSHDGAETAAVKLVSPADAAKLLNRQRDKDILKAVQEADIPAGDTTDKVPPDTKVLGATLAYPLIDGETKRWDKPDETLAEGFVADALLGNWDVVGLAHDNILWNNGTPIRVDQGGTLEFRAQGQTKPFGPVPTELWTMNSPKGQAYGRMAITEDGLRAAAADVESRLTPEKIDELVSAAPFHDDAMRERVRESLKARAAWLGSFSRGEEELPGPLDGEETLQAFGARDRDLQTFPEEDQALDFYVHHSQEVDDHLRSGAPKEEATDEIQNTVKALDALLHDKVTRTEEDFFGYIPLPSGVPKGAEPGEWMRDRSFMDVLVASPGGPTVLRITVPAGANALLPSALSGGGNDPLPGRAVLPRNTRLRITTVHEVNGQTVVEAVAKTR